MPNMPSAPYKPNSSKSIIASPVGLGGANRKQDVVLIQKLLNAVPFAKGGPNPLLSVDGLCGPKTCGAIQRFQQTNTGFPDGRVDPGKKTEEALCAILAALGQLSPILSGAGGGGGGQSAGGSAPVSFPGTGNAPANGTGGNTSNLRAEIKKWALIGANGPYGDVGGGAEKGIVSDLDTTTETLSWGGQRTVRKGWKNLKAFFDETVSGWTENHWKAPGYLDGVKVPGQRVPQPGRAGVSWCGIFATWCWLKAGKQTSWIAGMGPTNATKISGNEGIQIGDICVQGNAEVHHFVAVDNVDGAMIQGVNGNSDFQSILIKPMPRSSVAYYYRPE